MNWDPPVVVKRHGNILEYLVNCSTQSFEEVIQNTSTAEAFLVLQPYTMYNCCVFAVNEVGLGDPSCKTIMTHEAGSYKYFL